MAELILHHYDTSPFSEKIKQVLAFKDVPWGAIEQPTIMPKPHLGPPPRHLAIQKPGTSN